MQSRRHGTVVHSSARNAQPLDLEKGQVKGTTQEVQVDGAKGTQESKPGKNWKTVIPETWSIGRKTNKPGL